MNMPHNRLTCPCIHSKIKPLSVKAPLDALQTDDFVRRHTLTCLYINTDIDGWGWWESTWAEINSKSLTISDLVCSLQIANLFCPSLCWAGMLEMLYCTISVNRAKWVVISSHRFYGLIADCTYWQYDNAQCELLNFFIELVQTTQF